MSRNEYDLDPTAAGYYNRLGFEPGADLDRETLDDIDSEITSKYDVRTVPEEEKREVRKKRQRLKTAVEALKKHQNDYDRELKGSDPETAVSSLERKNDATLHSPDLTRVQTDSDTSSGTGTTNEQDKSGTRTTTSQSYYQDDNPASTSTGYSSRRDNSQTQRTPGDNTTQTGTRATQSPSHENSNTSEDGQSSGSPSAIITSFTGFLSGLNIGHLLDRLRLDNSISRITAPIFTVIDRRKEVFTGEGPQTSTTYQNVVWGGKNLVASLGSIIAFFVLFGAGVVLLLWIISQEQSIRGVTAASNPTMFRIAFGLVIGAAAIGLLWKFVTIGVALLLEPGVRLWGIAVTSLLVLGLQLHWSVVVVALGGLAWQCVDYKEYVEKADWAWWEIGPVRDYLSNRSEQNLEVEGNVSPRLQRALHDEHLPEQLLALNAFAESETGYTLSELQTDLRFDEERARFVIENLYDADLIQRAVREDQNRFVATSTGKALAQSRVNRYEVVRETN